jgi:hypothetical protein
MTDRPYNLRADQVRAVLDGRLFMLVVPLKPRGHASLIDGTWADDYVLDPGNADWLARTHKFSPGDTLWCREAWKPGSWNNYLVAVDYRASPEMTNTPWIALPESVDWSDLIENWTCELLSRGSTPDDTGWHRWEPGQSPFKWRSSQHMPRWGSRISLTVKGVTVKRVQDVTSANAIASGFTAYANSATVDCDTPDPRDDFKRNWNVRRGPDAWDLNDWCAFVEVERV